MISVVIPLYNKANSIARTIAAVRAQSVVDWELIVVDDGSSDEGAALVRAIDDKRIRLVGQMNAGVAAARNRGALEASAEWVAFLDADDCWEPDHLDNLLGLIECFPDATLCATAYKVESESGKVRKIRLRREGDGRYLMSDYFADVLEIEHPVCSSAVAVRKSLLAELGGFPLGVKAGEDIIMWARLACAGDVAYSARATATYVVPPLSVGAREAVIRHPQTPDYVGAALSELRRTCERHAASLTLFSADWHRIRAMLFLELNDRRASLGELQRAVTLSRLRMKDVVCFGLLALPMPWRGQVLASLRRHRGRG
jgi:cellulose synthase/poly-beta-1,6-N-acetylglucosamine synthase-like glycosyltransferase